jgi:O-antigen/teichoic acid export membrane protein
MVFVSVVNIINDLTLSFAIIILLPAAPVVSTPLILSMAVAVLNLGVLALLSARLFGQPVLRAELAAWKSFLREGMQIAVASLGVSIYVFIGPSILRYTRGDVEVGLFSAGYKFISIFTLLPATVNQVVFPIYSAFFGDAHHKLEKALSDTLRVLALLAIPLAAGTAILASKIFLLVYTRQYDPGIVVLQLMVMGNIFGFMDWVLAAFLLAGRRQLFLMKLSVATGLGVFLGGMVLIPRFGFVTLPMLSIATELTLFLFQMREVHRMGYHPLHPSALLKPMLGALVMSGVLLIAWSWSIFILVPMGALVYFVAIIILRGFGEQERKILQAILNRIPGVYRP